jgi:predicted transcriptional regulator
MSKLSQKTFDRVCENILSVLYERYPIPVSALELSEELARDNEFVSRVLVYLQGRKLVERVETGKSGEPYEKWVKWKLSKNVKNSYDALAKRGL